MFRQIIRFFSRFFQSKVVRTAAKVIFWIFAGYFIFSYFYAIHYISKTIDGMSFHEAATFVLDTILWPHSRTGASIVLGIIIGIIGYYRGRKKQAASEEEKEKEKEEEKPAEKTEPAPEPEEEIIETKHYMFH